ncbi:MAG: MMPL family transporter [Deltaproteobacteria bacterium]|nr:MMPL family transporter [Deltaproteobacteria bacterium]
MRRVSQKLTSASTLTIVAQGNDTAALKRFVDEAAPRIRALGPEWVGSVEDGVRDTQQFLETNKYLYAPYDDVKKLHDEVLSRYDYEVSKASGMGDLGLDDEAPPALTGESIKKRVDEARGKAADGNKFPGGYYLGEDGHMIVLMVRTPVEGGSVQRAAELRRRIDGIVAEVNPKSLDASMEVRYTGDFITSVEEYNGVKDDLAHVGVWGVGMVLAVVLLFFLRVRVLIAMALTIGIGLAWTFGMTRLTVGYLNSSTGFLVSIIAGNGINFGIIYMARYLEARRAQGLEVAEAIRIAHKDTWLATLAAAGAAGVAYGSLAVTDFRGFKHFGVIGGMGMFLCWLGTYLALPSILVVSERISPMFKDRNGWQTRARGVYGYLFAWLADKFPRPVVMIGAAAGVVATVMAVQYVRADPMEYNLQNLRNENRGESTARALSTRVDKIVGRMGQDGMAVMVDRLDQVHAYKAEMDQRLAAAPEDQKPFDKVVTAFQLLPDRQGEKLALISEMMDRVQRARAKGFISDKDWQELEPQLPNNLHLLSIADLPERMARPFTEADGTRGRIIYIVPKTGRSIWDARYLELWAASFREVKLPSGEVIKGSGRAVIFADMMQAVRDDAPKAILISLLGTVAVVFLAFRFRRASWAVLGTLVLGVGGLAAFLLLKDIKLNFLNFVAVPITFGVGADYAVNMMKRFQIEPEAKIKSVVIETGGAVILCSLTTMLGYVALMFSTNQAIVSFGMTAGMGEVTTLVAAVLVLPAALAWRARSRRRDATASDRPPAMAVESPSVS